MQRPKEQAAKIYAEYIEGHIEQPIVEDLILREVIERGAFTSIINRAVWLRDHYYHSEDDAEQLALVRKLVNDYGEEWQKRY